MTSRVTLDFPRMGEHADADLVRFLRAKGTGELRIAAYALNRESVVEAIMDAQKGGLKVRLITDHVQAAGREQLLALVKLWGAGVPIKTDHHAGLMHLKLVVRGEPATAIALGSFNFTNNAQELNDEVLLLLEDVPALAQKAAEMFDCLWDDQARFVDWSPPRAGEMRAMVSEMPAF
jgi:phosphatidylserine/phosphatidylglycerophosphate/cardiolipin synthase-like enzyme